MRRSSIRRKPPKPSNTVPAGYGRCSYYNRFDGPLDKDCLREGQMTWGHLIPRSVAPHLRDDPAGQVLECGSCNWKRGQGLLKPSLSRLPTSAREWLAENSNPVQVARYFTD